MSGVDGLDDSIALRRYLQRHIEPGLPDCDEQRAAWQHSLVIPAYRESTDLVNRLRALYTPTGKVLVILVTNRPDNDPDERANAALRQAIKALPQHDANCGNACLFQLSARADIYLLDLERTHGPTPAAQGVGLARKWGCDLALYWMAKGAISGQWIYNSDADAILPGDYFSRLENCRAAAAVFPFLHLPGGDNACDEATALYELRLHHYVLGLNYAGSPYAYHTLGSCLAVQGESYAQVRGFPRRSGGEDFYLLNKLVKTGDIARLDGACIALRSRQSSRVPFGTGPAVADIVQSGDPTRQEIFYHPQVFAALRALLKAMPLLLDKPDGKLREILVEQQLVPALALRTVSELDAMGLNSALAHCRRQGKDHAQRMRHFHQWFDGFRTLKFIHALSNREWSRLSLTQLVGTDPQLWPSEKSNGTNIETMRCAIRDHWQWQVTGNN